jgi:hypothetical protein
MGKGGEDRGRQGVSRAEHVEKMIDYEGWHSADAIEIPRGEREVKVTGL